MAAKERSRQTKDRAIRAGKLTQFLRRSHFLHNFCKESHTISKCHFLTNFPWGIHFIHILMISYAIEGLGYIESKKSHLAITQMSNQTKYSFGRQLFLVWDDLGYGMILEHLAKWEKSLPENGPKDIATRN